MPLSKNILKFLEWLETNGERFDHEYLIAIVGGPDGSFIAEEQADDPESHAQYLKLRKLLRYAASEATRSKWQPTDSDYEQFLTAISKLTSEDPLNEYVTTFALREVPAAVSRLKKLSAIRLHNRPSEEITNFFRQAVACYVCGQYDAVAVLSRSVLEFTLRETLTERGLLPAQSNGHREGSVRDLIDRAGEAKVIKLHAVQKSHNVRKTASRVHKKGISEREALTAVSHTLHVLTEIYGRKSITDKKG